MTYDPYKAERQQDEQDAADDVLDYIVSIYDDAKSLVERIQGLRACGFLEAKDMDDFIGALDDALTDLLADDWNNTVDKASIRLGGFPHLAPQKIMEVQS